MLTIEQIWEVVQRLEAEGRDPEEIEARVRELTLAVTGASFGTDLLRTMVGEAPIQNPLRSAKEALEVLPVIMKNAPEIGKQVVGAAIGLPKTIVDKLAADGPEALVKGAKAALDFFAEDLGAYGPGGMADPTGLLSGGKRGAKAIAKESKRIAKAAKEIEAIREARLTEIAEAYGGRHVFGTMHDPNAPGGWRIANREVDDLVRQLDAELAPMEKEVAQAQAMLREAKGGEPFEVWRQRTEIEDAYKQRVGQIKQQTRDPAEQGRLVGQATWERNEALRMLREGESPPEFSPEFLEAKARNTPEDVARRQAAQKAPEISGEVVEVEGVGQVSKEMAEALARQQARVGEQAPSAQRAGRVMERRRPHPAIDADLPVPQRIEMVRDEYLRSKGLENPRIRNLYEEDVDEAFHKKWADIYSKAENDYGPETRAAWRKMADEVQEQYKLLTDPVEEGGAGLAFEFVDYDPYTDAGSMIGDLEELGRIKVLRTQEAFHPFLTPQENDMFRAVHDVFGHGHMYNNFHPAGETQAAWQHLAMFSPEARPAVAVETLGQNSAFYHGVNPGFQEQKVFLPHDERLYGLNYADVSDLDPVPPWTELSQVDELLPSERIGGTWEPTESLTQRMLSHTEANGGSTIDPWTGTPVNLDGWAVSMGGKYERILDGPATPEQVEEFLRGVEETLRSNKNLVLGTWDDRVSKEAHGKWEMNLTEVFADPQEAVVAGMDRGQWGMLNLLDPKGTMVALDDEFGIANAGLMLDKAQEFDGQLKYPWRRRQREWQFKRDTSPDEWKAYNYTPTGRKVSGKLQDEIMDAYTLAPNEKQAAAFAILGQHMGRWYERSAQAIYRLFGDEAPRFSAVLASLSPNAPVKANLGAALDIWADWVEAGKPLERDAIKVWLDEAKVKWGVTPTNLNNLERVFNASDELLLEPDILTKGNLIMGAPKGAGLQEGVDYLSGLKIRPFLSNLHGNLQKYVMDAHMKSGFGYTAQPSLRKSEAFGAQVAANRYAKYLTEITGKVWEPANVQASQWSVIKTLKELSKRKNLDDVPEILASLTGMEPGNFSQYKSLDDLPGIIGEIEKRGEPFSALLHDPEIAPGLERLGLQAPEGLDDLRMFTDFLDDPEVRLGDLMGMARRIAQSTGSSLTGVLAMLLGRGAMERAPGLIEALGQEIGMPVREAYEADPQATMDYLYLMGENPEIGADELDRFVGVRGLNPESAATVRDLLTRRGGDAPLSGRRARAAGLVPPPPVPDPTDF